MSFLFQVASNLWRVLSHGEQCRSRKRLAIVVQHSRSQHGNELAAVRGTWQSILSHAFLSFNRIYKGGFSTIEILSSVWNAWRNFIFVSLFFRMVALCFWLAGIHRGVQRHRGREGQEGPFGGGWSRKHHPFASEAGRRRFASNYDFSFLISSIPTYLHGSCYALVKNVSSFVFCLLFVQMFWKQPAEFLKKPIRRSYYDPDEDLSEVFLCDLKVEQLWQRSLLLFPL